MNNINSNFKILVITNYENVSLKAQNDLETELLIINQLRKTQLLQ